MKTIKFESNYGNFAYRMTAEVGDEVNEATTALAMQGLANVCYRVCGSSVDKALGAKERKAVMFSDEDSERINAAVSKKLTALLATDDGKVLTGLNMSFSVTGQHEFGAAGKPGKEAEELWTAVQAYPSERFEKVLASWGLDADYDDEKGIVAAHRFLLDIKRKAAEKAKAEATAALANL